MKLRASEIFEKLSDLSNHEIEPELQRLCGDDHVLLADVRSLLAAHRQARGFLDQSVGDSHRLLDETIIHTEVQEQPGAVIGRTSFWSRSAKVGLAPSTWHNRTRLFADELR